MIQVHIYRIRFFSSLNMGKFYFTQRHVYMYYVDIVYFLFIVVVHELGVALYGIYISIDFIH